MLIIFRGMAGCGKSTVAREVSLVSGIPLVGKDDFFGALIKDKLRVEQCNALSYDILADICNRSLEDKSNLLIELALPHRAHMEYFLSRLNGDGEGILLLRCVCSDKEEWKRRIKERVKNPKPQEIFPGFEEMLKHYSNADTSIKKDEKVLDTACPLSGTVEAVMGYIKARTGSPCEMK